MSMRQGGLGSLSTKGKKPDPLNGPGAKRAQPPLPIFAKPDLDDEHDAESKGETHEDEHEEEGGHASLAGSGFGGGGGGMKVRGAIVTPGPSVPTSPTVGSAPPAEALADYEFDEFEKATHDVEERQEAASSSGGAEARAKPAVAVKRRIGVDLSGGGGGSSALPPGVHAAGGLTGGSKAGSGTKPSASGAISPGSEAKSGPSALASAEQEMRAAEDNELTQRAAKIKSGTLTGDALKKAKTTQEQRSAEIKIQRAMRLTKLNASGAAHEVASSPEDRTATKGAVADAIRIRNLLITTNFNVDAATAATSLSERKGEAEEAKSGKADAKEATGHADKDVNKGETESAGEAKVRGDAGDVAHDGKGFSAPSVSAPELNVKNAKELFAEAKTLVDQLATAAEGALERVAVIISDLDRMLGVIGDLPIVGVLVSGLKLLKDCYTLYTGYQKRAKLKTLQAKQTGDEAKTTTFLTERHNEKFKMDALKAGFEFTAFVGHVLITSVVASPAGVVVVGAARVSSAAVKLGQGILQKGHDLRGDASSMTAKKAEATVHVKKVLNTVKALPDFETASLGALEKYKDAQLWLSVAQATGLEKRVLTLGDPQKLLNEMVHSLAHSGRLA